MSDENAGADNGQTEFERFEKLTKELLKVPKSDVTPTKEPRKTPKPRRPKAA